MYHHTFSQTPLPKWKSELSRSGKLLDDHDRSQASKRYKCELHWGISRLYQISGKQRCFGSNRGKSDNQNRFDFRKLMEVSLDKPKLIGHSYDLCFNFKFTEYHSFSFSVWQLEVTRFDFCFKTNLLFAIFHIISRLLYYKSWISAKPLTTFTNWSPMFTLQFTMVCVISAPFFEWYSLPD